MKSVSCTGIPASGNLMTNIGVDFTAQVVLAKLAPCVNGCYFTVLVFTMNNSKLSFISIFCRNIFIDLIFFLKIHLSAQIIANILSQNFILFIF
jgi:hypothetical protein